MSINPSSLAFTQGAECYSCRYPNGAEKKGWYRTAFEYTISVKVCHGCFLHSKGHDLCKQPECPPCKLHNGCVWCEKPQPLDKVIAELMAWRKKDKEQEKKTIDML